MLAVILMAVALAACGVSSGAEATGRYRANWDEREELMLRSDGSFQHTHADGTATTGTWVLDTSSGDTRVEMREAEAQALSVPSIHRTLLGEIVITMNADENRVFVRVE